MAVTVPPDMSGNKPKSDYSSIFCQQAASCRLPHSLNHSTLFSSVPSRRIEQVLMMMLSTVLPRRVFVTHAPVLAGTLTAPAASWPL